MEVHEAEEMKKLITSLANQSVKQAEEKTGKKNIKS